MKDLIGCLRDERRIEALLALGIIASIIQVAIFAWQNNYLPPPFFYEPDDIYADWFNTAFWARNPGAYDTWTTLYPPLTFVFLRIVGIDECYPQLRAFDYSAGYVGRSCDWIGIAAIWLLLLLNIVLTYRMLRKIDPRTALLRTCCAGIGWPMLDAVERGNLFLPTYTCFILAVGPLLASARLRALAAGLAINFKIYLIAAFLPLVLRRSWTRVEMILAATALVYLFSYAILGIGTLTEIVRNLTNWSSDVAGSLLDIWWATSYLPLLAFLKSDNFPLGLYVSSTTLTYGTLIVTMLVHATQLLIVLSAASVALRPEAVPPLRLITLGVAWQ